MKALSVRQPWSWLIVQGFKDIENRTWQTNFRGTVLIHAGMTMDQEGYEEVRARFPDIPLPPIEELDRGGIVGQCDITDCVSQSDSQWFAGPYGFVMENAMPLPFKPLPGKLGFFDVELADQP
jgi:ASCH domain